MRFVYNDRKCASAMFTPNLFKDVWKFLDSRDDDLFATLNLFTKVAGVLRMSNSRAHLKKILDCAVELAVENCTIGYDDH